MTPRLVYALGMQSVKGERRQTASLLYLGDFTIIEEVNTICEIKERLSQKWGGWSPRVGVASWWAWPPACDFLAGCDFVVGVASLVGVASSWLWSCVWVWPHG